MPRRSYIRKGIERSLLRREQSLRGIRQHFSENMADNLSPESLKLQKAGAVEAMRIHILYCEALIRDLERFEPSYFDVRTQKFLPLTRSALVFRLADRATKATAHANEAKKSKSRREKNS